MLAYCGIDCESCDVFIATKNNDDQLKQEIAKKWGVMYQKTFTQEDIFCKGCKSEEVFGMCALCPITDCNKEKGTEHCKECKGYPCKRILEFYQYQKDNNTGVEII